MPRDRAKTRKPNPDDSETNETIASHYWRWTITTKTTKEETKSFQIDSFKLDQRFKNTEKQQIDAYIGCYLNLKRSKQRLLRRLI